MEPPFGDVRGFSFVTRASVFIDGGHVRALVKKAGRQYDADYVEKIAHACMCADEVLLRVLYYDCAPYVGTVKLPVSGENHEFKGSDGWLRELAAKDLFAVRRGVLKFRGFKPRRIPIAAEELTDDDFRPDFEQKGVDMRIGLDMANHAASRSVDRIILLSGDTDCLPAMKQARINGLQVVLACLPNHRPAPELLWHSDFHRLVDWPEQ